MDSMALAHRPLSNSASGIWEQNESTIRQLYEKERKTLKEVKQIMESEHGFPITPLSTYETKLRDRLRLRKKLKKEDWIAVHHHCQARDGKETGIYLNGTRIPWRRAWKEIRRSGARSTGRDQHTRLPTGVAVRTPSPSTEDLALRPLPTYQEQSLVHSPQLSISPSTGLTAPQLPGLHAYESPNTIQLFQRYQSRCTPMHGPDWEATTTNSFHLALEENVVALRNIPWAMFKNETLSIACELGSSPTRNFITDLLGVNSSAFWSSTPISPVFSFLRDLDPAPASSVSTWNINAYHLVAEAIYMASNNLLGERFRIPGPCPEIIQILLKRTPKMILSGFFQSNLPTVRSLWDVLAHHAGLHGYKDVFISLMEVGLQHSGWVRSQGHCHLASAVSMGALDVVRYLLKAGVRADDTMDVFITQPAIMEAAATRSTECVELLLGACDVNRRIFYESNLDLFLSALIETRIFTFPRQDHAYPPNSFRQIRSGMLAVDFDLEDEPVSRALDMMLDNGANVDLTYEERFPEDPMCIFYDKTNIPVEWHLTILERSYYQNLEIFNRLAPYSTQMIKGITRPGICLSAKQGKEALLEYLTSKSTDPKFYEMAFLELVLVEQFLEKKRGIDIEVVRGLIDFGVDPKLASMSPNANHLLCILIERFREDDCDEEFCDLLRILLQSGMVIDSKVLHSGIEENGIDILLLLSSYGANVSKDGAEALVTAARLENYEAVSWLLRAGVDINARINVHDEDDEDDEKWSIIAMASFSDSDGPHQSYRRYEKPASCEMLRYLIDSGAVLRRSPHDPNAFDFLHRLLSSYNDPWSPPESFRFFLSTIVDQHDLSKPGACLLEASLHKYPANRDNDWKEIRLETFELLLRRGVPVRDSHVLASLIMYGGRHELIQEVLNAGVDINAYGQFDDGIGITPIQAAASIGNQFLAEQLILMDADVNKPALGLGGRTALQAACGLPASSPHEKKDKLNFIQFLIDNGADINAPAAPEHGRTALQAAAGMGDMETALLLIHFGANPNAPPDKPSTISALDIAASNGRLDMVQFLLNVGALSWIRGRTGYRGAIWAAKFGRHFAIIDLIKEHVQGDFRVVGANLAMTFQDETEAEPDELQYYTGSKDERAEIDSGLDKIESEMVGYGS